MSTLTSLLTFCKYLPSRIQKSSKAALLFKYLRRGCCKLFIFCDGSAIFLILTGHRVWARAGGSSRHSVVIRTWCSVDVPRAALQTRSNRQREPQIHA